MNDNDNGNANNDNVNDDNDNNEGHLSLFYKRLPPAALSCVPSLLIVLSLVSGPRPKEALLVLVLLLLATSDTDIL